MDEKNVLRTKVRRSFIEFRRQIPFYSKEIVRKLELSDEFLNAKTIAIYWSLPDEVSTHRLITHWQKQKNFLLPAITDDGILLKEFRGQPELVPGGKYRIPEPGGEFFTQYNDIDLIIVPGIAFDKENNRLGRGGGYYDRLLPNLGCTKIGLCYHFQLFDKIPHLDHDIKVDMVIC
ncbi:MAG: 5-formyltetrahydrofolate cyclo-ligase [Bacteroidales bacterium]|nr:5-formyltetrahydrofolate cyclo-ligase [Bacteroidales bacterium]